MGRQAGFTLLETIVGAAIGVLLVWGVLAFADRMLAWGNAANQRVNAVANAERLIERMSSEAASSWAVFVPATDALGASNSDGHEVDFFTEDGAHRTYGWTYTFSAATKTLTRYALDPGNAASAGDQLADIDDFSASPLSCDATRHLRSAFRPRHRDGRAVQLRSDAGCARWKSIGCSADHRKRRQSQRAACKRRRTDRIYRGRDIHAVARAGSNGNTRSADDVSMTLCGPRGIYG